jgi:Leucine-rich repeat (LRR) protein
LTNLEPLRELTTLIEIDLKDCKELTSIEPLKDLINLQTLDLGNCKLKASRLQNLQSLNLSDCKLKDTEVLRNLTKLNTLILNNYSSLANVEALVFRGVYDRGDIANG